MKRIVFLLTPLLFSLLSNAQDFQYFATKDGVDIGSRYGDNLLILKFTNKRNEKVYVSLDKIVWKQGEVIVGEDKSGGGIALAPQEVSSSGMYFAYPKGFNSQNFQLLRFVVMGLKVEVGGMGKDPRYQKASGTTANATTTSGQGLPEIDFDKGATRAPSSKEWKPLPRSNVITFPDNSSATGQETNATQPKSTNSSKPSDSQTPNSQNKLNGLYNSNGTTSTYNTTSNSTENANQKQQYQDQGNSYLNKAKDNSQSTITQSVNLDLAKTNSKLAGNAQQVSDITNQQIQLRTQTENQVVVSALKLIDAINQTSATKRQWQSQFARQFFNDFVPRAEAGEIEAAKTLAVTFALGSEVKGISKDYNASIYWYEKAASSGDTCSLLDIATDYKFHAAEITPETKMRSLSYLTTLFHLKQNLGLDLSTSCKDPIALRNSELQTMIVDAVGQSFPVIKDKMSHDLLILFNTLFRSNLEELKSTIKFGSGNRKKLAKESAVILSEALSFIEKELGSIPQDELTKTGASFNDFILANTLPAYK